jgi:hypothetical protein
VSLSTANFTFNIGGFHPPMQTGLGDPEIHKKTNASPKSDLDTTF